MTPFDHAISLFRSGSTHDDVVARLIATGVVENDARAAARAAQPRAATEPAPAQPPGVRPGFHGWLLVATLIHGVYALYTLLGLAVLTLLMPLFTRREEGLAAVLNLLFLLVCAAAVSTVVAGLVLLIQRRRSARPALLAWTIACFTLQLIKLGGDEGSIVSTTIPLIWCWYFATSKQLKATLTE